MNTYIVEAFRTPFGKYNGQFRGLRPDDMLVQMLEGMWHRQPWLLEAEIDDVFIGCANQAGEDTRNLARLALLMAGYPETVPAITLNRLCSSGISGVLWAHQAIRAGEGELYLVGGVESMSRAPLARLKPSLFHPSAVLEEDLKAAWEDTTFGWRFTNPRYAKRYPPLSMAETADNTAAAFKISRQAQDIFALNSHRKAAVAQKSGRFCQEILPIQTILGNTPVAVHQDELIRSQLTFPALSKLKPLFHSRQSFDETGRGTITAGNAAPFADGGSLLLLCSERLVEKHALQPLAGVVKGAVGAGIPTQSGVGVVAAVQKLFRSSVRGIASDPCLTLADMTWVELHESFACQVLANAQALAIPLETVNPHGGGLALGHPLGASGARIVTTLAHQLNALPKGNYGLAAISVGMGQGEAVVLAAV